MKRFLVILIVCAAALIAGVYFVYQPQTDVFPTPTKINYVDVSGMTPDEANAKLSEKWRNKDFYFIYKGKNYRVPLESLTFEPASGDVVSSLSRFEKLKYFFRLENEFTIPMRPKESEEFMKLIKELPFCDNTDKIKTQDAYVDLSDFEFRTVKEKIGTEVDPDNVKNIAFSKIEEGSFSVDLKDEDIIRQPGLKADSKEFEERLKYCKDNLSFRLEYEIDGKAEAVLPESLDKLADYSGDKPVCDDGRIEEFILDIAGRCNEYKANYSFTTHSGRQITVQGVTFGNVLDQGTMRDELKDALEAQESRKMELKWAQYKYSGGEGIGNSYIETSIDEQHVWCYKNGVCIVDCDCVTGAPGHDTAKGVFVVQTVTGPTTLRGDNGDGSRYESPVNCFIPFYNGQGYHGSNGWRSKWGGEIYKTNGSHGCVNCPDNAAKKIADTVSYGYPVVIY